MLEPLSPGHMPSRSIPDELVERGVLEALREVIDPEVGINVVDLGLVYGIDVEGDAVRVRLTMTTAACPLGEQIVRDATTRLDTLCGPGVARVELVWDPPWGPERISAEAKEALGWSP